jgi:L-alanine-DL-glutamate epimerase-like enolase superfamily enzyme
MTLQAMRPLGIGVATGEHCANRVIFKQMIMRDALQFCQIDACRMGSLNEVLAVLLLAAKKKSSLLLGSLSHSSK